MPSIHHPESWMASAEISQAESARMAAASDIQALHSGNSDTLAARYSSCSGLGDAVAVVLSLFLIFLLWLLLPYYYYYYDYYYYYFLLKGLP